MANLATESETQQAIFEWANYQANLIPELEMLFAIPNGGARHPAVGARMKAEGVKRGYPDIGLDVPRTRPEGGVYHGFRLELKVGKNKPTPEQEWWLERLNAQGYRAVVAYGFDAAVAAIEAYLSLPEVR